MALIRRTACAVLIAVAIPAALLLGAFGLASRRLPVRVPVSVHVVARRGAIYAFARPADSSVHVVNTQTRKTIAVAHLGAQITNLRFAPHGPYLFATVRDDPRLREIDTRTGAILVLGER
ncbi:MAG: hypothetical protein ACREP1_06000 [Rhodanobacteraceae bacterium]